MRPPHYRKEDTSSGPASRLSNEGSAELLAAWQLHGPKPPRHAPQQTTASRASAASKLPVAAAEHVPPHNPSPQAESWKGAVQRHLNADSGMQHLPGPQALPGERGSRPSSQPAAWAHPARALAGSRGKGSPLPVPAQGNLAFPRLRRRGAARLEERDPHSKTPTEGE